MNLHNRPNLSMYIQSASVQHATYLLISALNEEELDEHEYSTPLRFFTIYQKGLQYVGEQRSCHGVKSIAIICKALLYFIMYIYCCFLDRNKMESKCQTCSGN